MKEISKAIASFLIIVFFVFPFAVFARVGVGVATGKIQVEEALKPGSTYELPPLTVLNTGDVSSEYEVAVTYHQDQSELIPPEEWFSFEPSQFSLKPGEVKSVEIKINLPVKAPPGKYFAYLEGHPIKKSNAGSTNIGIAAAAKLYFTVSPANIIQGIYYKVISIWEKYSPWTNIIAAGLIVIISTRLFKRFFSVKISLAKKEDGKEKPEEKKKNV